MLAPLPRRPALGLRCVAAAAGGLEILALRPGSAAALLLRPGDRLLALAGQPVADPAALAHLLRPRRAGEALTVDLARGPQRLALTLVLDELPPETCPGAHVLHDSLSVAGVRLRTLVVRPDAPGRRPAWLLLPGLACESQDFARAPDHPLRPLVAALAAAGVVTMRVERPGLGDSEGGPCEALGFLAERDLFAAGLTALRAHPFVDPAALGLFGHSVGGMLAPLLARADPVARVAVHGTCARPWPDIVRRSAERQAARTGEDVATLVAAARTGRAAQYTDELAAHDLAAAWSQLAADVLVLRGAHDAAVADVDVQALVDLLAARPRGRVEFLELPAAGHALGGPDHADPQLLAALTRFAGARGPT